MKPVHHWRHWAAAILTAGMSWAALAAPPIVQWSGPGGARVQWVGLTTLPMLDVHIDFDAGSRRDPSAQAGLAQATALMMDKGVAAHAGRPALDENALVEAWADLGAQWSVQASADRFSVRLRTLTQPDILSAAVGLAAHQLAAPAFPSAVWARERERLEAGWRQAQTQPDTWATRLFAQAVYAGHPYGLEPRPETWARLTVADMQAFHARHLRACDARVTLVGDLGRAQAEALVGQLMTGLQARPCTPLPALPDVAPLAAAQTLHHPFPVAQAQVLIGQPGFPRRDPDFLALTLANHILGGGGFTSRLMQEVREKRGLTYGIYSYFSPGRHAGAFAVNMQTRPDQARQAVDLIHAELRRFVQEGPSDEEIAQAKDALINGFALRLDSNRKLLDNVAAVAWNDLPLDYLQTWPAQVAAITREQLMAAVQRVLDPQRMVTVVVGGPAP
jgi:zinc protease